ncbi:MULTISPECIES: TetR/AcrR family transcriptional regulator [Mycolicibacterium]|jgi:AcrR family transcriptional regulator|uniref:TetR family transcriptional regulator n=1 Tax=Mycolicibacterium phocaicum TaxID=319706 RepID=A0A7I7ZQ87_9MYCO|nr:MULTISPECIES: TetR/AcrR family transcriptional regulator [Mycolicibacterium]MCX8556661.1 helix-turn-helix domain containing protein [Mycolicibacterium mucogenicum]RUP30524.1 MAG: TetR/AcrR family transcriptional regulator [Mycolicibacterium sp.]TLH67225.1 TetR family transcriptional regulator [Mycolicibacterium phocaicum]UCZ61727.1 TetR/AcrR family transcriptional regulator [Mycolicibacterium phocaicum]BBZ55403.1 TetR family transcriptional regulator [Mycolicibacterium phocaicum]
MANDWLAGRRTEVAAEAILDAADRLFAEQDAATVGMLEIARAAGCSRATLYRYYENRDVLHLAYVHREAFRVFAHVGEQIADITDPRTRLLDGVAIALRSVRESPALSSWFVATQRPIGGEVAVQSDVITGLVAAFLSASWPELDSEAAHRRANWLVRILVSLLMFPGADEADERAMLDEFVVNQLVPAEGQASQ